VLLYVVLLYVVLLYVVLLYVVLNISSYVCMEGSLYRVEVSALCTS
jgi:hypothetical protein